MFKNHHGIDMPIPFKPNVDIADLRQSPYNLSRKDKEEMDRILDPLRLKASWHLFL